MDRNRQDTGAVKTKFVGLVPPEHKNAGLLYESYQVEKLRKWAPVRTYYGDLGEKGERGSRWRLKLQLLTRHGIEDEEAFKPQPFSLIITISDPQKKVRLYDKRWHKSYVIASRPKILMFVPAHAFQQNNEHAQETTKTPQYSLPSYTGSNSYSFSDCTGPTRHTRADPSFTFFACAAAVANSTGATTIFWNIRSR